MKIYWSPLAIERLGDIYNFISKENISAAQKLTEKIFLKIETLVNHPDRGRKVPETARRDIREVFIGGYRIIYRIEPKKIIILTIRNFKQLLPEKELV